MNFELSDHETAVLLAELQQIINNDRYFLSPRIQTLQRICDKIRPVPPREPLAEPKHFEPPRGGRYKRRR
jgi:hypothetical protein